MGRARVLITGLRGHPLHPPLTDVVVGAYSVATIAVLLGWWDVAPHVVVPTAFASLVIALIATVPTMVTGLVDLLAIPPAAPARTTGYLHLSAVTVASASYLLATLLLRADLDAHIVSGATLVTSLVGFVFLTLGGWIGGSLVFGHGVRVVGSVETPTIEAVRPQLHRSAEEDPRT